MDCSNCWHELDVDVIFCPKCGHKVEAEVLPIKSKEVPVESVSEEVRREPDNQSLEIAISVLILALVLFLFFVAILYQVLLTCNVFTWWWC